ncbi:MAG TPA: hypothetical protein VHV26_16635 [Rhizomicrobium sp.]|jgi:hypothetical protein|nr:hypothetical protein [Rhizomicrobium sp.]
MKKIIAAFALTALVAGAADAAVVVRLGGHHHRHRVCTWHHHHRVCRWVR